MTWSKHSRRIDPISRSAKPFCQGEAGVMGLSRMPMARNRRVTTAAQMRARSIPRECFCDLARNPFCGRMCCDADPDQLSAIQSYYDVGVEQVEANGRDNEQVHSGDILSMITQKSAPSLAWRPASLHHVFGDTRLRDLKPELEQFAVDAWRAPKRILHAHSPDQLAQLRVDLRSPSPRARLPTPVAAKP